MADDELLELLLHARHVEQADATIGFELDEEVDVAVGGEVVAERAAEHREATNTVAAAESVDGGLIGTESAQHVHALRFSHHRLTRRRGVQGVTERTSERAICTVDRVGVDPERHRRVGVAESRRRRCARRGHS